MGRLINFILVFCLLESVLFVTAFSRQKRCIVIQKQSGTHGDSTEADEDYRDDVMPRKPDKPEKRHDDRYDRRNVETLSPEFLKYKTGPSNKLGDVLRYKNKLTSFKNRLAL